MKVSKDQFDRMQNERRDFIQQFNRFGRLGEDVFNQTNAAFKDKAEEVQLKILPPFLRIDHPQYKVDMQPHREYIDPNGDDHWYHLAMDLGSKAVMNFVISNFDPPQRGKKEAEIIKLSDRSTARKKPASQIKLDHSVRADRFVGHLSLQVERLEPPKLYRPRIYGWRQDGRYAFPIPTDLPLGTNTGLDYLERDTMLVYELSMGLEKYGYPPQTRTKPIAPR